MESVGIYEAKSKLSELVEKAEAGQVVTITRHGRPVAKLVPTRRQGDGVDRAALMKEIRQFSKTIKLKKKFTLSDLRKAIEWGRR